MFGVLSQIVFMQPVILTALLGLPVLWYILRITPPAPKVISFPPARLLAGLVADEQTPSKSPWWILLLRLLIVALMILALARPVLNPAQGLPGSGAVRIILDNSWAAAPVWQNQVTAAGEAITQAAREGREIYLMTTTANLGEDKPAHFGPLAQGEALSILRGLKPNSWPADYAGMIKALEESKDNKSIQSLWLSHGLDEGNIRSVIVAVQMQGGLRYVYPRPETMALLLRPTKKALSAKDEAAGQSVRIDVDAPVDMAAAMPVSVQALSGGGQILDIQSASLSVGDLPKTIGFDLPEAVQNDLSQFKISGSYGAGGVYLLDDQAKKRSVGIAASAQDAAKAPLIEASYYIKRALEPFANVSVGEPISLIEANMSVIILPDVGAMPTQTLNALEDWLNKGGLLLRYAGPNTADNTSEAFLLPVSLRAGGRSLSGAMSWEEPQMIAPFAEDSPYFGLPIPADIEIKQQVLADPAQDLEGKVWAQLSDGTPFITAAPQEKGLIVLVHTTANTDWSNFALSGLYVSILRRTLQLAGQSERALNHAYKSLEPLLIMDGMGALSTPPPSVRPLPFDSVDSLVPSSFNPPGLYGRGGVQYAFNIGSNLAHLQMSKNLPISVEQDSYDKAYEIDIMPYLLYGALILFLIDWLVMIFMIGRGFSILKARPIMIVLVMFFFSMPAHAQDDSDLRYATGFYLAYIETGDTALDSLAQQGLEALAKVLTERTSVEPAGVVGLNPERDTLAFFPVLYWAMSENQARYSDKALGNIQAYLDNGGTILFDTRDQNRSTTSMRNTESAKALRQVTGSLNIPPIMPIPSDHVLGRSFYLLDSYPGAYSAGTLWVEQYSAQGRDNVSSVIIGSNDWISSWAQSGANARYSRYQRSQDSRQHEMAMRFGVNLVMYALTGNYKADQVHIPHILKRLGQ